MYIPKNKIKTNLYTHGGEYQYANTKVEYIGNYWTMYNGKIFTGKNPNDQPREELIPLVQTSKLTITPKQETIKYVFNWDGETVPGQIQNRNDISSYNYIKKIDVSEIKTIPQQYFPLPTDEEYELGIFTRYFIVRQNQIIYQEINKDEYEKIKKQDPTILWAPYTTFTLQWTLKGFVNYVEETNYNQVIIREERINRKGLQNFLRNDYLYLYAPNSGEILYSNGEDGLVLPNGEAYIGNYHVMVDGTIMTGKFHGVGEDIVLTKIYD
tara:strand:+ start:321 stop:1124 length:804 start_codon:yes stop_codon:yes gene_type:complete